MSPKHYAKGANMQRGTVLFNGTKVMKVIFPQAFIVAPTINLTLGDVNNSPPYKKKVTKNWVKIKFKTPFTGEVDWQAFE